MALTVTLSDIDRAARLIEGQVLRTPFLEAPRSLNELVACKFSYLTKTRAPVSSDKRGAWDARPRS